jgi:adenylate cyclase
MANIFYFPDEKSVEVAQGENILDASCRGDIPLTQVCGGVGRCSTCRVLILEGLENCSERSSEEKVMAEKLSFPPNIRLACQTKINGDVRLRKLVLDEEDAILTNHLNTKRPSSIGEEKEIAILFSDIRGFTTFSEKMAAYDVIHILNRYFYKMGQIISEHSGYIDNYMGDGLLALFGVQNPQDATLNAVNTGLKMLEAVNDLNNYLEPLYNWRMNIGIGIHYGNVVIGTIGNNNNKREMVIGDSVNFASRIEGSNKALGTNLLISEKAYGQVKEKVTLKKEYTVAIRGKTGDYLLYEIDR